MNKLFKFLSVTEVPLLTALLSIIYYNMDNIVMSWVFGMLCGIRLLINISKEYNV